MPTFNLQSVDSGASASPEAPRGPILWSPQQQAVFAAVQDLLSECQGRSLRVDSVAGSGKTTTCVETSRHMRGRSIYCAFNRRIVDEGKPKFASVGSTDVATLHSVGLRAWKNTVGDVQVEARKLEGLADHLRIPWGLQAFTRGVTAGLKGSGVHWENVHRPWMEAYATHHDLWEKLPETFDRGDEDPFEYVVPLLKASVDQAQKEGIIDFDDMLYMPVVYGRIEPEYDWVIVDEIQDTNWIRRQLIARMVKPDGGRVLAVGDPHQAIYGFTGADADAMDLISQEFRCAYLPLTVTYRCPKAIVAHARQWVSHIEAAPEAPEGLLTQDLGEEIFREWSAEKFTGRDAILCRNTKPLVSLALQLIRRGVGARVEGREIGQSLLSLVSRYKQITNLGKLRDKLDEYAWKEGNKLRARHQEAKAAELQDRVDSLAAVIDSLSPSDQNPAGLRARINSLFGDTEPGQQPRVITLSTVHKSKGREWDRVYLLGRNQLMPSKFARQDWQLQQEKNLIYVAVTRAKKELLEVEYVG